MFCFFGLWASRKTAVQATAAVLINAELFAGRSLPGSRPTVPPASSSSKVYFLSVDILSAKIDGSLISAVNLLHHARKKYRAP
jgi:hypothetical protein